MKSYFLYYFDRIFLSVMDRVGNWINNWRMKVSKQVIPPPSTDQFEINGQLSPDQFKRAGQKLTQISKSWTWKPSPNPKYMSKYLDQDKQYLVLEKALCRRRIGKIPQGQQQKLQTSEDGEEVIVLNYGGEKQEQEEDNQENYRFYNMYIVYDQYYHTPRMFFSATDLKGTPVENQKIRDDIQPQYLDKTLTMEPFPFIQGLTLPTVHPCRHANVLKSMSDAMRESGHKVESHYALLIFLKFITSVIPTVQFDLIGDLHFE